MAGRFRFPINDIRYFDLYHGVELKPAIEGNVAVLSFSLEAHGFGAVYATTSEPLSDIQKLTSIMRTVTASSLSSYANEWKSSSQKVVDIAPGKSARTAPDRMVRVAGSDYVFKVEGIEIEGFNDIGVDVQYPWEDTPRRFHEHYMNIKPFYIDKYLVTNAQFKTFLDATRYTPQENLNFLPRLEERRLSRRMGEQAGHLGFPRRCSCLCEVGRQTASS